jgi:DNA-directed RNA polymerase subunit K/omega
MALPVVLATAGPSSSPADGPLSGFHLVSVVFQRAKQLQNGARPRVEAGHHKATRVALLEVLADTVSWTAV